ncbi:MAG: hypothetical protein LBN07_04840 [Christensenellaceae bacterium]|jgi:phage FluMu protein Com|nr:hypothetical protein [Christensenellaceae bacterium]
MINQQNTKQEFEIVVSCRECGHTLFSGVFKRIKVQCPKCKIWNYVKVNEKGELIMARAPPEHSAVNQ